MSDERKTHSDGGHIDCPVCGKSFADLWDYDWGNAEDIETECGWCEAPLVLSRRVSVDYTAKPRERRKAG